MNWNYLTACTKHLRDLVMQQRDLNDCFTYWFITYTVGLIISAGILEFEHYTRLKHGSGVEEQAHI